MFAEMTPGTKHSLLVSKGFEQNCRPEKLCHISGSRSENQNHRKAFCFRNRLMFCFKERRRMKQRETPVQSVTNATEGQLRELASKWFIETQAPLITHNGFFPSWFLGFISRVDAEEILREKELGTFLIRLSDKAIGYILSYKGRNRCRHFVINQSKSGQFVVCGESEGHSTVSDLIEHYKMNPIEPFGEYLTSPCSEMLNEDLYDVIQVSPREKSASAIRKQQINSSNQLPTRPPRASRTLQDIPPLPQRSKHLEVGSPNDRKPEQGGVMYTELQKKLHRELTHICQNSSSEQYSATSGREKMQDQSINRCSPIPAENCVYSLLLDNKTRSLPLLDSSCDGAQSYRLSATSLTPLQRSPMPLRQATSYNPLPQNPNSHCRPNSNILDYRSKEAVYHLAGRPGSPHAVTDYRFMISEEDTTYAEVSPEFLSCHFHYENTYEQIPGHEDMDQSKCSSNTYESLDDHRHKPHLLNLRLKNNKCKWLFPEAKRK
ncbi:SH2 domain-containing protein 7-like [Thalassophryne amazonica]|uniref:SH2 domain-containing protein 7-like n=1 Tax=Thalassophryne amazonica TaxID=390379 RepID=UPI001471D695|nr:SH2 domain-containing protein 7-like [Thalassophryne amazonica]